VRHARIVEQRAEPVETPPRRQCLERVELPFDDLDTDNALDLPAARHRRDLLADFNSDRFPRDEYDLVSRRP
jgi:hypothetical protein